jgi:hypothetical protein
MGNRKSSSLKVVCRALARTTVLDDFEAYLLAFDQSAHASALNSRDVDENVRIAVLRLNEAETLGGVEKLDCADVHNDFLSSNRCRARDTLRAKIEDLRGNLTRA